MPGLKGKQRRDLSVGKHLRSEASLEIVTNQLNHVRLFICIRIISGEQLAVGEICGDLYQQETKGQICDLEPE